MCTGRWLLCMQRCGKEVNWLPPWKPEHAEVLQASHVTCITCHMHHMSYVICITECPTSSDGWEKGSLFSLSGQTLVANPPPLQPSVSCKLEPNHWIALVKVRLQWRVPNRAVILLWPWWLSCMHLKWYLWYLENVEFWAKTATRWHFEIGLLPLHRRSPGSSQHALHN